MKQTLCLTLFLAAIMIGPSEAAERVGIAEEVADTVRVTSGEAKRVLRAGDPIFMGDGIETDDFGGIQIRFLDGSKFVFGAQGRFVIDEFIFQPESGEGAFAAHLAKGVFEFISGKLSLKNSNRLDFKLPVGTLGIRGTTVIGDVQGTRSDVVLLKSQSEFMPADHIGHIVLSNVVNGMNAETHLRQIGYGSTIMGEGESPSAARRFPDEVIGRMLERLPAGKGGAFGARGSSESAFDKYFSTESGISNMKGFRRREEAEKTKPPPLKEAKEVEEEVEILELGEEVEYADVTATVEQK